MTFIQEQKHRGFLMDPINNMYQTVFRETLKLWFMSRQNTLLFSLLFNGFVYSFIRLKELVIQNTKLKKTYNNR